MWSTTGQRPAGTKLSGMGTAGAGLRSCGLVEAWPVIKGCFCPCFSVQQLEPYMRTGLA